ncbi:MAG: HDIG domain-containing protein [Syntrophales bacterium]|nr:HDIG domain-containing protein [Syntrophales bacterium]
MKTLANELFTKVKKSAAQSGLMLRFTRNILLQRWVTVICMSLLLSLLLTPHIHFIHPTYKVASIATKNIRADRDFLVEDRASTEQKKMEAIENIKPVYDYDRDIPLALGMNIARAFTSMEEKYCEINEENSHENKQAILKKAKKEFEETLGTVLTVSEFNVLSKYNFSFDVCNDIVKLIYSTYNNNLISQGLPSKREKDTGIIVRNVKTQNEKEIKDLSSIFNIKEAGALLRKQSRIDLDNQKTGIEKVAVSLTKRLIRPNLTFNKNEIEKRKQIILDNVKHVYSKVQKNEMIIREGEKITPAALEKLEAFFKVQEGKRLVDYSAFLGMFLIIIILSITFYYMSKNRLTTLGKTNVDILFLGTTLILQILLIRAGIFTSESITRVFTFIPADAGFYAIPFTVGAMLITVHLSRSIATIFSVFSSYLATFLFNEKMAFFLFSFLGSVVAINYLVHCKQRTVFLKAGLLVGMINIIVITCLALLTGNTFSADTLIKLAMGIIGGVVSGIIVAGIAPLFESLFGYTTDIKLLELANLNQPVFQQMIIKAPGTYHHSIIVASMVEAAAEAIGVNSLLAKVGAYYHDIGKMKKSPYFIENQRNGENKHDKLSPKMSSLIIISHVKNGCELANKYKLGKPITDIIKEHHGTGLVSYFYEKAKKDSNSSIRSIPESDFRYSGPKPQTREAGLVLLGDVVEASSRMLTNPTPSRIRALVKERFAQVLADGQLDECKLTLSDLNGISESFIRILNGIFHQRIDYPQPVIKKNDKVRPFKKVSL